MRSTREEGRHKSVICYFIQRCDATVCEEGEEGEGDGLIRIANLA